MTLKINKKAILEEFELNPFKAYAKYKIKKEMGDMDNGTYKPETLLKDTRELAQDDTSDITGTWGNTINNIHKHNAALDDAMKMLDH